MKKTKKLLKRAMALFCVLLILSGNAFASRPSVNTAMPLGNIKDTASAMKAVQAQAEAMASLGMLQNVSDARYLGRFAEYALAQSGAEWVDGNLLEIYPARVEQIRDKLEPEMFEDFLDAEMEKRDWEPFGRGSIDIVAEFQMGESDITIIIDPDVKHVTSVHTILVRTPFYDLTFRPFDLQDDLDEPLTIVIQDISETLEPLIQVSLPGDPENPDGPEKSLIGYLTLYLSSTSGDLETMSIVKRDSSENIISVYNDVTSQVGGKIHTPGVYIPTENREQFNDLEGLSSERKEAIYQMVARHIVNGYSDGGFHPYAKLNRGQFVKIIMNAVGKTDNSTKAQYSDVKPSMYYYHHAAAAQKMGYMNGYDDGMFHGEYPLNKAQICAILGRILTREKHYQPSSPLKWLGKYENNDEIPGYAHDSVVILSSLGILDYSSHRFDAGELVNRADTMVLIQRTLRYL